MKNFIYVFVVLIAFCSCAKDYPQLVRDRVEQYQQEGKIILSQSNDSTGKEHYIVYADVKAQIIGIDTLENAVSEIALGKKNRKRFITQSC